MELSPLQTLAGWLIYVQKTGENGPMFPPRGELEKIVSKKEGRYEEAEAMAQRFCERYMEDEPGSPIETGMAGMKFVKGVQKLADGFLSSPPLISGTGKK